MLEDYKKCTARRAARLSCPYSPRQPPYLAVLDDVLKGVDIVAQEPLGLVEIPSDSHCGHQDQRTAHRFFVRFYAPAEPDTEFAVKWSNLCGTRTFGRGHPYPHHRL